MEVMTSLSNNSRAAWFQATSTNPDNGNDNNLSATLAAPTNAPWVRFSPPPQHLRKETGDKDRGGDSRGADSRAGEKSGYRTDDSPKSSTSKAKFGISSAIRRKSEVSAEVKQEAKQAKSGEKRSTLGALKGHIFGERVEKGDRVTKPLKLMANNGRMREDDEANSLELSAMISKDDRDDD
eukprot:Platyproteum_vivax@DN6287_c0_g1_i2.p1